MQVGSPSAVSAPREAPDFPDHGLSERVDPGDAAALALARALVPGSERIPAADAESVRLARERH